MIFGVLHQVQPQCSEVLRIKNVLPQMVSNPKEMKER